MRVEPGHHLAALILGGMVEQTMRRPLILLDGSVMIFVTRSIPRVFVAIGVFVTLFPSGIKSMVQQGAFSAKQQRWACPVI